jgi:hypothetical protein
MIENVTTRTLELIADGTYEWVVAQVDCAVHPTDVGSARIVDLDLVPADADSNVRFHGGVVMLRPVDGGNGLALLSVPNRGFAQLPFTVNATRGGTFALTPTGDGNLLREGRTVAFPGWQWDVPSGPGHVLAAGAHR